VKTLYKEDYKLREKVSVSSGEKTSITLPASNVIKYTLEDESWFVVRPSGTEPKMKAYMAVKGHSLEDAEEKLSRFKSEVISIVNRGFEN